MRATWNGTTIAESDDTVAVEGSHYSPAESVRGDLLAAADAALAAQGSGTSRDPALIRTEGLDTPASFVVDGEVLT
jgi:hypothetical protein